MRLQQLEFIWPPAAADAATTADLFAGARRLKHRLSETLGKFLHRTEIELTLGAILWTTLIFLVVHSN